MTDGMSTGSPPKVPMPSGPLPTWQPPQAPRKAHRGLVIALVVGAIVLPVALCSVLALTIGGFAAYWATHQVSATSTNTKSFAVSGIPTITIHDPVGNVSIVTGDAGQVVVQATKRASDVSQATAQRALATMSVTSTQNGSVVDIEGTIQSASTGTQRRIDLQVTVPAYSTLDVTTSVGNLTVTGVSGVIRATVSVGHATLEDVTASGASTIRVPVGNLRYDGALDDGTTLDATVGTGNADILLSQDSATKVEASTGVGNITVSGWPATVNRSGAGATTSIYLKLAPRNTLTVHVGTGNISLSPR